MSNPGSETADSPWKQTVRDIFDELHFGPDSVFTGQGRDLAVRIVRMIEDRHHAYFCEGKTLAEWERIKNG